MFMLSILVIVAIVLGLKLFGGEPKARARPVRKRDMSSTGVWKQVIPDRGRHTR